MPRRCILIRGTAPNGEPYEAIATFDARKVKCSSCGADATLRCDYPVKRERGSQTCDRWLCSRCARTVGPDLHNCPPHARLDGTPDE